MSIIVDGYNYIGRSQEFKLQDPSAQQKIVTLMGEYCARVKKSLTLVFDGSYCNGQANRKRKYGRVTVIYTSPIYSADDAIKKMIEQQKPKRRKSLLIVSSDDQILQFATSHGAPVAKSEDFERTILRALFAKKVIDREDPRVSPEEVREWIRRFEKELLPDDETPVVSPGKRPRRRSSSRGRAADKMKQPDFSEPEGEEPFVQHTTTGKSKSSTSKKQKRKQRPPDVPFDRVNIHLSKREVDQWLNIFSAADEEDEDEL